MGTSQLLSSVTAYFRQLGPDIYSIRIAGIGLPVESGKMRRFTIAMMFLAFGIGLSGCTAMTDSVVSVEMGVRNRVLAQKAWGHWSWCYDTLDNPYDFACGFKAGYRDVLQGGSGCQPTLPPRCYWKPQHQTPAGRCKAHAWFDGFSHGALAAKQDGYGDMGQIPISPTAQANLDRARQPAVQNDIYSDAYGDGGIQMGPADPMLMGPPPVPGMPGAFDMLQPEQTGIPAPLRPYDE